MDWEVECMRGPVLHGTRTCVCASERLGGCVCVCVRVGVLSASLCASVYALSHRIISRQHFKTIAKRLNLSRRMGPLLIFVKLCEKSLKRGKVANFSRPSVTCYLTLVRTKCDPKQEWIFNPVKGNSNTTCNVLEKFVTLVLRKNKPGFY